MEIREIYGKFSITPNLQEHMTRVFGIVAFIQGHWKNKSIHIDWDLAKKLALLHDLGNIVKFDLDKNPDFLGTEQTNIKHWREKREHIINTYGFDDHEVTAKMLREIVVSQDIIETIENKSFGNAVTISNSDNWLLKILFYADMRALPTGIDTLSARLEDIRQRMPKYSTRPDFLELCEASKVIERQIQSHIDASVLDIRDSSVETNAEFIAHIDLDRRLLTVLFDTIGRNYGLTRRADPRITGRLIRKLNKQTGSTIVDIGAGIGNYSAALAEAGYKVIAVEPSLVMRSHAKQRVGLEWIDGSAENLPLPDVSADGIIITNSIHHFNDLSKAFSEMARVLKPSGKVVIFNPKHSERKGVWIDNYFKPDSIINYPSIKEVSDGLKIAFHSEVVAESFPMPADIEDMFFISGWRRPWLYLDDTFCENVTSLAKVSRKKLKLFQDKLRDDLLSGKWLEKYGQIMKESTIDAGYYFYTCEKA